VGGRGNFQLCRSICGGDDPDPRFDKIVYAVYSTPALAGVFATGEIKNANMVCNVDYLACEAWIRSRLNQRGQKFEGVPVPKRCLGDDYKYLDAGATFAKELAVLNEALENTPARLLPAQADEADRHSRRGHAADRRLPAKGLGQGRRGRRHSQSRGHRTPKRHRAS
jgi:hypothetical protein